LRSQIFGDVLRLAENGAQDNLGGIGLRAGDDRAKSRSPRLMES
jgi:hypothetical protein